jgi:sugar (pentulose or hexulose) kinase
MYTEFQQMISKISIKKVIEPNARRAAYYRDLYEVFLALFEKVEPIYDKLAEIKAQHA